LLGCVPCGACCNVENGIDHTRKGEHFGSPLHHIYRYTVAARSATTLAISGS
jgi:hypothetical protein